LRNVKPDSENPVMLLLEYH